MKVEIDSKLLKELLKKAGVDKDVLVQKVKFKQEDITRIEEALNRENTVVIRRHKSNPSEFELVNLKYVKIEPRYNFEKKSVLDKAHLARKDKSIVGNN